MKKSFLCWAGLAALGLGHLPDLHAQRAAAAWAAVDTGGVVTNITVSAGGAGYLAAPGIVLGGGGGSKATVRAVVANGSVAAIQILSGGSGYTNAPSVGIDPPEALVTVLGLGRGAALTLAGEIGSTQEVQAVESLGGGQAWATVKSTVLTNGLWSFQDTNASAAGQRFYRAVAQGGARPATPEGMVWLPPGTFRMGSPLADPDYLANEGPQTEVRLTQGFFLGRKEVSQGEYAALMRSNPSAFAGDSNRPVETVRWREATNYCARLTQREQAAGRIPATWRYRLPTEAEWEYAARAGGTNRFGFREEEIYENAWLAGNSLGAPHPTGAQRPNAWGLYDLAGNVAEWCADACGDYPGAVVVDPQGATQGQARVVRGGGGVAPRAFCRAGARDARSGADYRDAWVGFRVVLALARAETAVDPAAAGSTISGCVTFKDSGLPAPGVAVYLVDTNQLPGSNYWWSSRQGYLAASMTGQDGKYSFSGVKAGNYLLAPMNCNPSMEGRFFFDEHSDSPHLSLAHESRTVNFVLEDSGLWETGGSYVSEIYPISYLMQPDQFDPEHLAEVAFRLLNPKRAVDEYLKGQLAKETLALLASTNAVACAAALARDFNQLILGPECIYEPDRFADVALPKSETDLLNSRGLTTRQVRWLNRQLVYRAFYHVEWKATKRLDSVDLNFRAWWLMFPHWAGNDRVYAYNSEVEPYPIKVERRYGYALLGIYWEDNCLAFNLRQKDSSATETTLSVWAAYWPLSVTPATITYEWDLETQELVLRSPTGRSDYIIWKVR